MKQLGVLLPNPGQDPLLSPPPPFTPLAFYQVSLTNFCYPFILLGGDRHCKSKVFCTRTQHIDWNPDLFILSPAQARLQMQTSRPWVHLTNHKNTMSPQEGRVYDESFVIRNKLIITPKKNSLIWFLNRDYWSKLIKIYFFNSISNNWADTHVHMGEC